MKIALLNDTHLGIKSDSRIFLEHQRVFFHEVFFPYCRSNEITTIIHLGDVFDRRKFINFYTLDFAKRMLFDVLQAENMIMHTILGNHDTTFTTTNDINSVSLLLREYKNIHIYEKEPVELNFDDVKFLLVPWITRDNETICIEKMKTSNASICCGHFEIKGFELMRGISNEHGFDHSFFSSFEEVYSGHFHHPSQYGNIRYLGAQYEMTWSDYNERRGFHVFDTKTKQLTLIENPNKIFHKLEYDDLDLTLDEIANLDLSALKNCYVKVLVRNRTNTYLYDLFLNRLNDSGAADVKTVEDHLHLDRLSTDELLDETKSTKDILHMYIDNVDTKLDRSRIKAVIDSLYTEAMSL
jgi:DNA repair exonuclease SbcCD nuclease subunit